MPLFEIVLNSCSMAQLFRSILIRFWRAAYLADKLENGIIKFINHTLFERNNGIVCDVNLFRTDLGAAFGNVAIADAKFILEELETRDIVQRVHLQCSHANKEARAAELFFLVVIANHMADVLA